jgi:DNA-binding GntR family transcriptional regulator
LARTPEYAPDDAARSNEEWVGAHAAFHLALIDGCDSPWLIHLHSLMYAQSERYRRLSVPFAARRRNVDKEHRAIVNAAIARDAEAATRLLAAHLQKTTQILLNATTEGRKPFESPHDRDMLFALAK